MGKRAAYFVDGMVRMLRRVRPQFKTLSPDRQHAIASLIWQASGKSREHSKYDGAVFFTYQELEKKFGRGAFLAINERMDLFEVFRDNYLQSHTRGYKLKPDIVIAQQNMLKHIRTHRPAAGGWPLHALSTGGGGIERHVGHHGIQVGRGQADPADAC
jgi:hypothetical protein